MILFRAALPQEIWHVVVQQNQKSLTMGKTYNVETIQQREVTDAKRVLTIET
jgi:hypothetical protein